MGWMKKAFKSVAKVFNKATGHDQKKKADHDMHAAQQQYNEAERLKNEFEASVRVKMSDIENKLRDAINQQHQYEYELSNYDFQADRIAGNIDESKRRLEGVSQNILNQSSEFESNLSNHQREINEFNNTGKLLQEMVDVFKKDVPELSSQIEEYTKMPQEFLNQFDRQKARRADLAGFSMDERGKEIEEYEVGVEELKEKRSALEKAITERYQGLSSQHKGLLGRQQDLMSRLGNYTRKQDRLIDKAAHYDRQRLSLENIIQNYKNDESRHLAMVGEAKRFKSEYDSKHRQYKNNESYINNLVNEANNYQNVANDYQNQITNTVAEAERLQGSAAMHAKKAKKHATRFAFSTMALGGLAGGLGYLGSIGSAASSANAAISGTGLMGLAGITSKLGAYALGAGLGGVAGAALGYNTLKKLPSVNVPDLNIDSELYNNFHQSVHGLGNGSYLGKNAPISSGMLGSAPAMNIPQLGGMQQPNHFGISQMPEIHELPNLETALGRLRNPKELGELTLGLAKSTSKEGTSYNYGVLLDPFFNKNFKKVMKKAQKYRRNSYDQYGGTLNNAVGI